MGTQPGRWSKRSFRSLCLIDSALPGGGLFVATRDGWLAFLFGNSPTQGEPTELSRPAAEISCNTVAKNVYPGMDPLLSPGSPERIPHHVDRQRSFSNNPDAASPGRCGLAVLRTSHADET